MQNNMLRTVMCALVIGAFSFVVGCGNDPVKDMEKLSDKMCACKDKACADKVEKEMEEMGKKYKGKEDEKPSEEQMKKLMAAMSKYSECQMKLNTAGGDDKKEEPKPE